MPSAAIQKSSGSSFPTFEWVRNPTKWWRPLAQQRFQQQCVLKHPGCRTELKAVWAAEFGATGAAAAQPEPAEDDGAGVADGSGDALRAETAVKEQALAEVATLKEEAASSATAKDEADSKVVELTAALEAAHSSTDASAAGGAEEVETAQKAAAAASEEKVAAAEAATAASEEKVAELSMEIASLKAAAAEAAAAEAAAPKSVMPAEAEALFAKAKAADEAGDKPAALAAYQTGVKTTMAYLKVPTPTRAHTARV